MNDTDSFFVFRYCDDPTNCVIGSATPDGKFIEMAFDPPGQYSSLTGARISSGGDALLFKATRGEESEELYILLKGANSLVQLTNGTQVPAYSWMEDARVAYSGLKAEVWCEGGISRPTKRSASRSSTTALHERTGRTAMRWGSEFAWARTRRTIGTRSSVSQST